MKKHWRFKLTAIVAILLFGSLMAANAGGIWNRGTHSIEALWKFIGAGEIRMGTGSELRFDSGSTLTLTNVGTLTAAGLITATHIANPVRELVMPGMAGWVVDSSNDIDDATAPNITVVDNIPAAVWDDSSETTGIMHTFRLPTNYVSGLIFHCLVSSDTASGTSTILDWQIWVNGNDVAFDAAAVAQTGATGTSTSLDASGEVFTLTLDATGEAAVSAGSFITVELFNATTHASANLELKGVTGVYTSTM